MEPARYLALIRRNLWVFVVAAVLGACAGFGYASVQTPQYQGTTTVFLALSQGSTAGELVQGATYTQGVVESYAAVATMPVVLQPVIDELGLDLTPRELGERVTAEAQLDTTLVSIAATSDSPEQAAAIADAVSAQLAVAVRDLSPQAEDGGSSIEVTTVGPSTVPQFQVSPNTRLDTAVGALLGMLAALVLVVVRDVLDVRVRDEKDVEQVTGAPVVGRVPHDRGAHRSPVVPLHGHSPRGEAYRQVRTNLGFLDHAGGLRSVVVTAGTSQEGKTTTAVNVAQVMAAAGLRVLLVDADLRRPAVAGQLGIEGSVGLSTVLIGRVALHDAIQPWGGHGLRVLTAGEVPPNPTELLGSELMSKLVSLAEQEHDLVVIDAAPVLPVTDPAIVAKVASGALLVVNTRRTTRSELDASVTALETAGARILGVILNQTTEEHRSYYGQAPTTPWARRRARTTGRPRAA